MVLSRINKDTLLKSFLLIASAVIVSVVLINFQPVKGAEPVAPPTSDPKISDKYKVCVDKLRLCLVNGIKEGDTCLVAAEGKKPGLKKEEYDALVKACEKTYVTSMKQCQSDHDKCLIGVGGTSPINIDTPSLYTSTEPVPTTILSPETSNSFLNIYGF